MHCIICDLDEPKTSSTAELVICSRCVQPISVASPEQRKKLHDRLVARRKPEYAKFFKRHFPFDDDGKVRLQPKGKCTIDKYGGVCTLATCAGLECFAFEEAPIDFIGEIKKAGLRNVSRQLGVSHTMMNKWVKRGKIPVSYHPELTQILYG